MTYNLQTLVSAVIILLACAGFWTVLFRAPVIPHLVELLSTKEPMTAEDMEDWFVDRGYFGWMHLYYCMWCQAFWVSLVAGAMFCFFCGTPEALELSRGHILILPAWALIPVYTLIYMPFTSFIIWKTKQLEQP